MAVSPVEERVGRSPRRPSRGSRHPASPRRASRGRNVHSSTPNPSPGSPDVVRGRSRVRKPDNPLSDDNLRRRGYHSLMSSFGKIFHVEKRWKLIREMGSGAYGVVISAADEISGETVAIKQVTRIFDKVQLAKRALREITLLRHFANHENITGLIDLDAISSDFNEIYIFMEPMEADLHQIIKSGQALTTEHVQYFLYQLLRGMKYIHSAGVVHRDLKPGNLLVNADCELKICDFGLSRGFDQRSDENSTQMTEYVATRWYRAPEIMLAFRRYNTAIDVWSIGCIFAELLTGKTLFKGKDYVDQLNKILEVLGSPQEYVIKRIGSDKAQAYVRSLPFTKKVPFKKIIPMADASAIDLLEKMLAFDPADRLTVPDALRHPWLAAYHDINDEPDCPAPFDRWRALEALETIDDFRAALWEEIQDYRREARSLGAGSRAASVRGSPVIATSLSRARPLPADEDVPDAALATATGEAPAAAAAAAVAAEAAEAAEAAAPETHSPELARAPAGDDALEPVPEDAAVDPVVSYARRSSLLRTGSAYSTFTSPPHRGHAPIPAAFTETSPGAAAAAAAPQGGIPFPSDGYVFPGRARTMSHAGAEATRRLLRTLSTVSIHESGAGVPGGLAEIAPIGRFIREAPTADALPSEMPEDFVAEWGEGAGEERGRAALKEKRGSRQLSKGKKAFHIQE